MSTSSLRMAATFCALTVFTLRFRCTAISPTLMPETKCRSTSNSFSDRLAIRAPISSVLATTLVVDCMPGAR
ncbi:hypothetical protein D3C73_1572040 [compost metagenome]